ncbi:MAG: hypothetical protein M3464_14090 [Chloroflexota bacterium]|nr:hypothetical protein [Chloroflexota bacterium]
MDKRANEPDGAQTTIAALLEQAVDAEHALSALRKADQRAEGVSLLVRSQDEGKAAAAGETADGAVDVARGIVAAALGAVAQWLIGLAELIVPERGRYLVAGPMGAVLAGGGQDRNGDRPPGAEEADPIATDLNPDRLVWVLTEFGFASTEATYIEHRLTAGATLVAMTTADAGDLDRARHVFSEHGAVYIDDATTNSDLLTATAALLSAPADLGSGEVDVADVVARIRPVEASDTAPALMTARGRKAVAADGDEIGTVEMVLVEDPAPTNAGSGDPIAGRAVPRYVVLEFGGVLGIGRHHVAIPIQLVDLAMDPVRVQLNRAALSGAPEYNEDGPLGRREEERIFRFYAISPYWIASGQPAPAVTAARGERR